MQMNMEMAQVMHMKLSRRLLFPCPVTIRMLDLVSNTSNIFERVCLYVFKTRFED